jgi:hypothetical protein
MAVYSFVPPFRKAKFCGVPSCDFDKSGCAAGEKTLRNTDLEAVSLIFVTIQQWELYVTIEIYWEKEVPLNKSSMLGYSWCV